MSVTPWNCSSILLSMLVVLGCQIAADPARPSNSVNTISQSLRDLSALIVKTSRPKVVVKIMYDRGSWEQLWNAHAPVNPEEWAPLDLPTKEDVPGLHMEVVVSDQPDPDPRRSAHLGIELPSRALGHIPCEISASGPQSRAHQQQ